MTACRHLEFTLEVVGMRCRQQTLALDTVKELVQVTVMWAIMCTDLGTLQCRLVLQLLRYMLFSSSILA